MPEDERPGDAPAKALPIQRNVILSLLFAQAAAAWTVLFWQSASANMDVAMTSSTMGVGALLCLTVMMVAMMFPSAAPMILAYHHVQAAERRPLDAFGLTWVFMAAYIFAWTLAGAVAYAGALATEAIAARTALSPAAAARIGGATLVAAGVYQFAPLKELFLAECRAPITFVASSWRDGAAGALRMGLLHAAYCLGCCWLLFVILFPLGIMNLGAIAAVTLIILAEKILPWPRLTTYATGVALVLYGALVIASPQLLPTFPRDGGATMPADMRMTIPESSGQSGPENQAREPSEWERHRREILLILAAQTALLIGLLYERRRRKHAETQAIGRGAELAHFNRVSLAGELTATIAHELSQPLTAIQSNAEVAKHLLASSSPNLTELQEIVTNILQDDERANEVLRRLRSLLRKAPFERRECDLNAIVRQTTELLSGLVDSRGVDVRAEIVPGALRFLGDRVQIQQVIINLIMNAMDAMSAVPRANRRLAVNTRCVQNFAEVAVSDAGPGVPIDDAEIVFRPFFTTKPEGMGMGLSIARSIVEAHGGRIWATNQTGGGAVFRVRLPLST